MQVDPENIIIGAGTDHLYNLLPQLLGQDKIYALEEPGYEKIWRTYAAAGVSIRRAAMDSRGVLPDSLGDARVLHFSPAHHFPTGTVTDMIRRQQLLNWANEGENTRAYRGETSIYKRRPGRYGASALCFWSASLSAWPV